MNIKLITGATIYEAGINTIKQIDVSNYDVENLIVVPDTFSLQAEKLVFECLNIKSAFNIKVVGISRLAGMILWDNNINFQRISSLEEVFNIYQAVKENEDKFLFFKKCELDFCRKILEVIKQFKSSKISPQQIAPIGDKLLDDKMHDLKLIYQSYENLLGEKLDLSKLFDFSLENAKNKLNLSKINLYFANFDSFSLEIGNFVWKLAECVNKVYIGYAMPIVKTQANAFIYETAIFDKLSNIAEGQGIVVPVDKGETKITGARLNMVQNLFALDVKRGESKYFTYVLAKNKDEEVEYVAKYIKNKIYHGALFKDFSIAVSDSVYYDKIKDVFDKYKITYYSDDATNLTQTILGRFLLKLFEIAKNGFEKATFEYLVAHPLLRTENVEEILKEISFYNIDEQTEFVERFGNFHAIVNSINMLAKCKTTTDYVNLIKDVVKLVDANYQQFIEEIDKEKLYKTASENMQAKDLIVQVLDKLAEIGGDKSFDLFDFETLFTLSLQSVKVETIPTYIDSVFVGDVTTSYFEDSKVLFVLGATANALPKTKADTGIIDDDDIKKMGKLFVLEPEIKVLNRRSRLKLFECLQHALDKLIVCCPTDDGKNASFVSDLQRMFGTEAMHTQAVEMFDNADLTEQKRFEDVLFYLGDDSNLLEAYTKLKANDNLPSKYAGALKAIIKDVPVDEKHEKLSEGLKAKFSKNTYSVTQLEEYFSCPFRRFVEHDLKICEEQTIEPDSRKFGSFAHKLLEKFVEEENLKVVTEQQIDEFLAKNMMPIAQMQYDKKVLQRRNFANYLRKSSKIILKSVVYENKHSGFSPEYVEEKISIPIYGGKKLNGKVDRIDMAGDYYRILDYKTGSQSSIKTNLYFGKKLQLFLYADAIKKRLKMDCAGVYYFNCQTKYNKTGKTQKLLTGLTKKDNDVAELLDERLKCSPMSSDIVSIKTKKKVDKDGYRFSSQSVETTFDEMFDYANNVAIGAVKEIEDGYIEPKPLADECNGCPYVAICKHRAEDGNRQTQKIDKF